MHDVPTAAPEQVGPVVLPSPDERQRLHRRVGDVDADVPSRRTRPGQAEAAAGGVAAMDPEVPRQEERYGNLGNRSCDEHDHPRCEHRCHVPHLMDAKVEPVQYRDFTVCHEGEPGDRAGQGSGHAEATPAMPAGFVGHAYASARQPKHFSGQVSAKWSAQGFEHGQVRPRLRHFLLPLPEPVRRRSNDGHEQDGTTCAKDDVRAAAGQP